MPSSLWSQLKLLFEFGGASLQFGGIADEPFPILALRERRRQPANTAGLSSQYLRFLKGWGAIHANP